MAVRDILMTATGITGIKSIRVTDSHNQASAQAEIVATGHSLNVGDAVTVSGGFADDNAAFITNGLVKSIEQRRPEYEYTIVVNDGLTKAIEDFLASDNPDSPFMANNVSGEQLVVDLLGHAGITGVATQATGFTFAVVKPTPLNLISVWDAVENICRITGFVCYADSAGNVHFKNRKPYIVGGDASERTFTVGASGDILTISYHKSDERLRNRVVVYGAPGIFHTGSAASPYVPGGFFKTMVVAHELIDTQPMAVSTADVNLTMFNRLTERVSLTAIGKPSIRVRDIVDVSEPYTGLAAGTLWYVFGTSHRLSQTGYEIDLNLVR